MSSNEQAAKIEQLQAQIASQQAQHQEQMALANAQVQIMDLRYHSTLSSIIPNQLASIFASNEALITSPPHPVIQALSTLPPVYFEQLFVSLGDELGNKLKLSMARATRSVDSGTEVNETGVNVNRKRTCPVGDEASTSTSADDKTVQKKRKEGEDDSK